MTHWLQIGGIKTTCAREQLQWDKLNEYVKKYADSEVTVYLKYTGDIFSKIVKLECDQSYNDLDLDCNSMFNGSIKHLNFKPKGIEVGKKQLDYYVNRKWGVA